MTYLKKCLLTLVVALFANPMLVATYGQSSALYYNKVDNLKFGERISLHTNAMDWITLTPNFGLEYTLGNKSWNKWTLGVSGRINWNAQTKDLTYNVYDIYDGKVELRKYWHGKNPRRVFYWGVYGDANKFNIKFSEIGKKGNAFTGGLMVGTVTQLYGYQNGASLDLDLGINAGVVFAKYDEYRRDVINKQHVYTTVTPQNGYKLTFSPLLYAVSTDVVKVGLTYHFGTKVANRYKKRQAVDESYRIELANKAYTKDTLRIAKEERKRAKHIERARNKRLKEYEKAKKQATKAEEKVAREAEKKKKGAKK